MVTELRTVFISTTMPMTCEESNNFNFISAISHIVTKRISITKNIIVENNNANKIFYNKSGYTFYKRNRTYDLDEEAMREILKKSIYNLENFDDKLKNFLIDKTKIKINIIHPNRNKNHSCSGNIADFELR